jgi:hypothetical protein
MITTLGKRCRRQRRLQGACEKGSGLGDVGGAGLVVAGTNGDD